MAPTRFQIVVARPTYAWRPHRYLWRVVTPNNRQCMISLHSFPDVGSCEVAIKALQGSVRRVKFYPVSEAGCYWYIIRLDGSDIAKTQARRNGNASKFRRNIRAWLRQIEGTDWPIVVQLTYRARLASVGGNLPHVQTYWRVVP